MKITDVKCVPVSYVVPEKDRYRTDFGWAVKYDNHYVIIETDEGITGYGASYGTALPVKTIVETQLRPMLIGEDPLMIERLWHKMYCGSRCDISLAKAYTMPVYFKRGETLCAISAVDIALWDILGKALGQPLWKILGGCRDRIRCYASGGWATADKIGDELRAYTEKGFRAVKMRAEGREGPFTVCKSLERVKAAREALGPDIDIYVDAHACMDLATAIQYAIGLEEYDVGWLEEPITPDDHASLQAIRSRTTTPIATGERESTRFDYHSLMKSGGVDIIQPDLGVCGGITEGRRIGALTATYGKKLATHNFGNPIIAAASLHFALSQPTYYTFEVELRTSPLVRDSLKEPMDIRDGYAYPSDKPGIGVELQEDFFERYPFVPGPEWVY